VKIEQDLVVATGEHRS